VRHHAVEEPEPLERALDERDAAEPEVVGDERARTRHPRGHARGLSARSRAEIEHALARAWREDEGGDEGDGLLDVEEPRELIDPPARLELRGEEERERVPGNRSRREPLALETRAQGGG